MTLLATLGGAALKAGLGRLLGGKKKPDPTPRDNLLSQAAGAREASDKYGFNPLTMLQYGQTAGAMGGGGAPPLASAELIAGAIQDVADVVTGETARRQAANEMELELGKIKLDQLRGNKGALPGANSVGSGPSPLGRRGGEVLPASATDILGSPLNLDPILVSTLPRNPLLDPVILRPGKDGGIAVPEPRLDTGSGAVIGGVRIIPTPGVSPSQVIENEYGDVAQAVYGLGKFASDFGTTIGTWAATSDNSPWQKPKYRKQP